MSMSLSHTSSLTRVLAAAGVSPSLSTSLSLSLSLSRALTGSLSLYINRYVYVLALSHQFVDEGAGSRGRLPRNSRNLIQR